MMHWLYYLEIIFHKLCLYLYSHEDENGIFLSINNTFDFLGSQEPEFIKNIEM